jgi:predicted transcriptional regulator
MKDLEKSQFDPEEVVRDLSGAEQHFLKFNSANFCLAGAGEDTVVIVRRLSSLGLVEIEAGRDQAVRLTPKGAEVLSVLRGPDSRVTSESQVVDEARVPLIKKMQTWMGDFMAGGKRADEGPSRPIRTGPLFPVYDIFAKPERSDRDRARVLAAAIYGDEGKRVFLQAHTGFPLDDYDSIPDNVQFFIDNGCVELSDNSLQRKRIVTFTEFGKMVVREIRRIRDSE